jgi:PAP2 superfamily
VGDLAASVAPTHPRPLRGKVAPLPASRAKFAPSFAEVRVRQPSMQINNLLALRQRSMADAPQALSASLGRPSEDGLLAELLGALRAHEWLIGPVLAYIIIASGVAVWLGEPNRISLTLYGPVFTLATPVLCGGFLVCRAAYLMLVVRPARLSRTIIDDLLTNYLTRQRLLNALPIIVLLPVFNSACTSIKAMIPLLHAYNWDATLSVWDARLHFGVPPWQILQPIFGYPTMTGVTNIIYCFWFFGLAGSWFWQAFSLRDQRLRMQFFITYIVCFAVMGNLVAIWMASGGPCYYGRLVHGPDLYAPLMEYLRNASQHGSIIWSVRLQDVLWDNYASDGFGIGSGISAMPSMHVAGALLFALLGWRTHRGLGILLSINVVLIMIATVHLGWHYAIDGYVAVLGTLAIWWAVGAVIVRYHSDLTATRQPAA